jgi:MFS family permease
VHSAFWAFLLSVGDLFRHGLTRLHDWNGGRGARESGLARLVEVHALQTAGDAFVTVALAGSLFFAVPTDQARTRVGLYLLIAMAPFAVVAPILGPLLDRFRHGRRYALAATMLARATLALVIGRALSSGDLSVNETLALYPAALGVLVAQKTYSVARGATVPRVLPAGMTLVQANSRLTLVGVFAPALAGGFAILVTKSVGHLWGLRAGAIVYLLAGWMAVRLPRRADGGPDVRQQEGHPRVGSIFKLGQVDAEVAGVLRSAATLRWLAGFLLFYGAFVVQEHSIGGLPKTVALAALAVGIGVGNLTGTLIGSRTSGLTAPRLAVVLLTVTGLATFFAAIDFGLLSVFTIAVVSSAAAAIAKLGLDATIQRRADETVRTSVFARSETTLQLAWVVGGAIGILLPTKPIVGFAIATAVVGLGLAVGVEFLRNRHAHPAADPPGHQLRDSSVG